MTNTELIKKLDPSENFIKNKYAREYLIPEFDKTLSIEDVFYLYKNDKLDVSLLARTEDDRLENIDDRLFSNFRFTQNTREGIDSLIRCFVTDDNNYDGTPLKTPKDEKKLLLYIKAFLEDISQKISKGELNFKEDFRRYLENIKNL